MNFIAGTKFTIKGENAKIEYTIREATKDSVLITWNDALQIKRMKYDPLSVDKFIAEGTWILSPQEANSATRYNAGKPQWTLFDVSVFEGVVRVLEFGAKKYGVDNWKKGFKWSSIMNSMYRHLYKWWYKGEENDEESGLPHMDHVACNVYFMLWHLQNKKELDDRNN